ncbi:ATP-binding cassette domain-containing protein [Plantactinospora sp. KBS50]|uniref:ATP-binding cassette domain-containing protein n=1 Tax=Plantactinospora sp. KBS50 TaxID=2024580 RepID=UPI000BAAC96C|nr:ATP-binding cassette domain-containing protein [Plantactinospora sp. KBS50]ASW53168.1 multidrug ABC transporter ATP-binding protein [Plantactinospora sp. KBS50]
MSVTIDKLAQGYGKTVVIDRLTLTLQPGITALLGPNGAGKTTLLRTLATILPPRFGTIRIDGIEVDGERGARRARDRIGYLPQDFGVDPQMTVSDFVEYAAWLRGVRSGQRWRSVGEAIDMVDLADQRRTKMRKLSGGMRRRAGIAWAIVGRPRLILLDEPTVGLDPRQRLQFRKIITSLGDAVVVLSTHLIDDVEAICDRVVVLHGGVAKFDGTVQGMSALGPDDLPGHSALERAYMHLLPESERRL